MTKDEKIELTRLIKLSGLSEGKVIKIDEEWQILAPPLKHAHTVVKRYEPPINNMKLE